jgi:hypothetical protein
MKNSLLFFLMILFASTANHAQSFKSVGTIQAIQYKSLNDDPSPAPRSRGKKLKRIGLILTGSGIVALGGGVGLLADAGTFSANTYKHYFDHKDISVKRIVEKYAGYALIDLGTYAVAGGIVMIIIGNKKIRREKARVNFTFTPVSAGLCYRF